MLVLACRILSSTSFPNDSPPPPPPSSLRNLRRIATSPAAIRLIFTFLGQPTSLPRRLRGDGESNQPLVISRFQRAIGRRRCVRSPEEIAVVVAFRKYPSRVALVFRGCGKLAIRLPARLNETRFTLTRICTSDTRRCPIGRGKASLHGCPLNS